MKIRNLIHALLIVSLVCGHLVANVHFVGHFHAIGHNSAHDCESAVISVSGDCVATRHLNGRTVSALVSGQWNSIPHDDSDHQDSDHGNSDCAIYHAYLGVSSVLCTDFPRLVDHAQRIEKSRLFMVSISFAVSDDLHIRGPPSFS